MTWLLIGLLVVIGCFGYVLLFGAPYLPTLNKQVKTALDMLDLKEGETLLELGCGDGRVLVAAAARGWKVIGYELNPILVLWAWLRTRKYGKQVEVKYADFWKAKWPPTEGIYGFILPRYMAKLDKKVVQDYHRPVKVVSFAFAIPGKEPVKSKDSVFLYRYN